MEDSNESKKSGVMENENLHNAISSFKKFITDFKTEKKSEWESLNEEFKNEMDKIENSIKKLTSK
jgi:hypothetical protein